jgi:hypothetical protein
MLAKGLSQSDCIATLPKRSLFMSKPVTLLSICVFVAMTLAVLPARAAAAPKTPPSPSDDRTFQIGSSNTVTADPLVPRPNEKPCVVPLFSNFQFVNFNIQSYSFTPPADCPGPWDKVVFTADFSVTAGRQFDRTAIVDLAFVNLYFGTTPEPRQNLAPAWHVERDVTGYSALFKSPQSGNVILGNIVNGTFTGVISGSATLEFYQAHGDKQDDATRPADAVYPLRQANGNEPALLFTPADQLATAFTLPHNVERAYLDVITQSQIGDEFWYSCVPNDVAAELQSCGGTAFREGEVTIDGTPAGVAPVYPWIYTGGIDPFLWEPIPGVQALNFVPYRVDLTPFAALLSDGNPHTIALSVFNANNYFAATATLLVYLDHDSPQVTGEVTANTIGAANPSVQENLQTDASGDVSGTVTTGSSREFQVTGFVNTSHGRVDTDVHQTVQFNNLQTFTINSSTYIQDISQTTDVTSKTIRRRGPAFSEIVETFHYPLTLNLTLNFAADGSVTQLATASQRFNHDVLTPFFASSTNNQVDSVDTLDLNSSFHITGNVGQKSSQHYSFSDTRGHRYDCTLRAESNVLTSASEGCTETDKPNR